MPYQSNDYYRNKREPNFIIYLSITGEIFRLCETDFSSKQIFEKWKSWSDDNYRESENTSRWFYNSMLSSREIRMLESPSAEKLFFHLQEERKQQYLLLKLRRYIQSRLTKKQYRRLSLYYLSNMTEAEIANVESVGQRRISASIISARKSLKKIVNFLLKQGLKLSFFI